MSRRKARPTGIYGTVALAGSEQVVNGRASLEMGQQICSFCGRACEGRSWPRTMANELI
jgi:hypothetical protein